MHKRKPRAKHTSKKDVLKMNTIINDLLLVHNIEVRKRSKSATGMAYYDRSIKIPYPTNIDKFCVCLHEIGHHVNNDMGSANWSREYNAEQYALWMANKYGFDTTEYEVQAKRYVLVYIAEGLRNGLCLNTVPTIVKEFVSSEVNINEWANRKPYFEEWGNRYYLPIQVSYL